jgi:hypothetical protein
MSSTTVKEASLRKVEERRRWQELVSLTRAEESCRAVAQ